jgi:hypothetical protein
MTISSLILFRMTNVSEKSQETSKQALCLILVSPNTCRLGDNEKKYIRERERDRLQMTI